MERTVVGPGGTHATRNDCCRPRRESQHASRAGGRARSGAPLLESRGAGWGRPCPSSPSLQLFSPGFP